VAREAHNLSGEGSNPSPATNLMTTDYSDAIERGVSNWLDSNRDHVVAIIADVISARMAGIAQGAAEGAVEGMMAAVGKFLNDNGEDLKAGIAMAIATSWAARQHPVPK
jgi:hypothetical protein